MMILWILFGGFVLTALFAVRLLFGKRIFGIVCGIGFIALVFPVLLGAASALLNH